MPPSFLPPSIARKHREDAATDVDDGNPRKGRRMREIECYDHAALLQGRQVRRDTDYVREALEYSSSSGQSVQSELEHNPNLRQPSGESDDDELGGTEPV